MRCALTLISFLVLAAFAPVRGQPPLDPVLDPVLDPDEPRRPDPRAADPDDSYTGGDLLAAGARSIRFGRYDDGIRLTLMGLERPGNVREARSSALSNLCAAHAAKNELDVAIAYCEDALELDNRNWRAFTNRSYAHWRKGLVPEALFDLDAAVAINPRARQTAQLRGMITAPAPRATTEDRP